MHRLKYMKQHADRRLQHQNTHKHMSRWQNYAGATYTHTGMSSYISKKGKRKLKYHW